MLINLYKILFSVKNLKIELKLSFSTCQVASGPLFKGLSAVWWRLTKNTIIVTSQNRKSDALLLCQRIYLWKRVGCNGNKRRTHSGVLIH